MNQDAVTVFGFDFGKKRIGIAVGQTLTASARPLTTIRVNNDAPDWEAIDNLIQDWRPARFIVGLPTQTYGDEHPMAESVQRFAAELQRRYAIAVDLVDERLSSHEAAQIATTAGKRTAPHSQTAKENLDRIAARIILETWLTEQTNKKK